MKMKLFGRTKKETLSRRASVGFYKDEMMFIGVMAGHSEVSSARKPFDLSNELLGQLIEEALSQYNPVQPTYSSSDKELDWPSYKESGLKTIRQFENGLVDIDIEATDQELVLLGSYRKNQDLCVTTRLPRSCSASEFGSFVKKIYEALCALLVAKVI
jgi:hypothetical protein